jgi:tetratricopeptide (TPR) repeat protein
MGRMKELQKQLHDYIQTPRDAYINAKLGEEYEKIGQGAAATSYFLRAAELLHDSDPKMAYNYFLKTWKQIHKTTRRPDFEKGQLQAAIAYSPHRPEAYYHLSIWYSDRKEWMEAYMYACLGRTKITNGSALPYDIGYPGDFVFDFQKAFTGWYVGKREQSKSLFLKLGELKEIPQNFKTIIAENIRDFGLQ